MWGWGYDLVVGVLERRGLSERRRALLSCASGRVLELGAGTGLNFPLYPPGIELTAVEPDASMRRRALARAGGRARVLAGDALSLGFPDASFDTVVFTLVLCSVPDVERALEEAVRVLAPGGRLVLLEHVRPSGLLGRAADWLTPVWKLCAGGCRLNRDPRPALERLGLAFEREERFWAGAGRGWVLRKPRP